MQRDEILRKLEEIVPAIQSSNDAEGTLLKFASDLNLSPAQLEAVTQVYNTGRALTFYAKSASRGANFKLVNTEPLIERYTDHCKKAGLQPAAMSKSASTSIVEGGRFPHFRQITGGYETLEKAASVKDEVDTWCREKLAQMRESDAAVNAVKIAEEIKASRLDDLRDKLENIKAEVRFDKQAFFDLEEDAHDMWKSGGHLTVFNTVANYLKSAHCDVDAFRYSEAKKASRAVSMDRTGLLKIAEAIKEDLEFIRATDDFIADLDKSAAVAEPPRKGKKDKKDKEEHEEPLELKNPGKQRQSGGNPPPPRGPGGGPLPNNPDNQPAPLTIKTLDYDAPDKPQSKDSPLLKSLMEGYDSTKLKAPSLKAPLMAGRDLVGALSDGKNRRQMKRDQAVEEDNTTTALQRLMVTDPILAEATPEDVIQHFNTIHEIAPSIATDPQKLKLILREAVTYGSIPMHTLKELLEVEKLVLNNSQMANKNRADQYGPSGIFKRTSNV